MEVRFAGGVRRGFFVLSAQLCSKKIVKKATASNSQKVVKNMVSVLEDDKEVEAGRSFEFKADPPLLVPLRDLGLDYLGASSMQEVEEAINRNRRLYRQSLQSDRRHLLEGYQLQDVARKVVGVGSVGTRCWIALFAGFKDGKECLFCAASLFNFGSPR